MSSRRLSDSKEPSRSVPPAASADVKAARNPGTASAKNAGKRTTAEPKSQAVLSSTIAPAVSADERRGMIAASAYLRAERRSFAAGGEAEDWLAAEKEIDALLKGGSNAAQ